jgi:hypothetical protein
LVKNKKPFYRTRKMLNRKFAIRTFMVFGLLAGVTGVAQNGDTSLHPPLQNKQAVVPPTIIPLNLPTLKIAPVHDLDSLQAAQRQTHNQVLAALQDLISRNGPKIPQVASPQPVYGLRPGLGLFDQTNLAGNAIITQLAPIASIFANGDQLGNRHGGNNVDDWKIFNAGFFSDPPAFWQNDSGAPLTGIFNSTLAMTSPDPVATTTPNGSGLVGVTVQGALVVGGNVVSLVIPCYYLPGWGAFIFNHAHFEVQVEQLNSSGQWSQMTRAALDMYANGATATGYTPPTGVPDTVINVAGNTPYSMPWIVPIALPDVANTLRVDLYAELYDTDESVTSPGWSFPNGSVYASQVGQQPLDHQNVGTIISDATAGHNWDTSPAFQVIIAPTYFGQMHALPYTIIYTPPGNNSDVQFKTTSTYGTMMGFQVQNQTQVQVANVVGQSFKIGANYSFNLAGVDLGPNSQAGINAAATFGNQITTTSTVQTQTNNTETLTINSSLATTFEENVAKGNPPPPAGDQVQRWEEPFWGDMIDVIINPVFAIWSYPSLGEGEPAFSAAQVIAYGQGSQSDLLLPVNSLYYAVLVGTNYTVPSTTNTFTPQECAALLNLDPFYSGGAWQGASLDPARFVLISAPGNSLPNVSRKYDSTETTSYQSQLQVTGQYGNTTANQSGQNSATFGGNIGPISGSATLNQQQTATTNIQVQYQSQVQTNIGNSVESVVTIQDSASLGSMKVYQDLVFGGLAVQDPNEPNTGPLIQIVVEPFQGPLVHRPYVNQYLQHSPVTH